MESSLKILGRAFHYKIYISHHASVLNDSPADGFVMSVRTIDTCERGSL